MNYNDFISNKAFVLESCGINVDPDELNPMLFDFQRDIVLEPFGGIGSVPYVANKLNRRAIACELKTSYYNQMVKNVQSIQSFGSNIVGEECDFSEFGAQMTFDEMGGENDNG